MKIAVFHRDHLHTEPAFILSAEEKGMSEDVGRAPGRLERLGAQMIQINPTE